MSGETQQEKGRFLTEQQRSYLRGHFEPKTDNAEYQMRSKIRDRTEGALDELFLLGIELSNRDAKHLFDGLGYTFDIDGREPLPGHDGALASIIALAFRGFRHNNVSPNEFVASVVKPGIRKGEADYQDVDPNKSVSVSLSLDELQVYSDVDELSPEEKYSRGLKVSPKEVNQLRERVHELATEQEIEQFDDLDLIDKYFDDRSN